MRKLLRSLLVFFTLALTLLTVLVAALALTPLDLQRESVEFTILPAAACAARPGRSPPQVLNWTRGSCSCWPG
jgi:hypothetical protein